MTFKQRKFNELGRANTISVHIAALKVTLVYAVFSLLWIFLSDQILLTLVKEVELLTNVQMYKGWTFVIVTACLVYACLFRKLTTVKRMENILRESESTLARAQQVAHLGSWSWDVDSNKIHWSDEMYSLLGFPLDYEPTDESVRSVVHPEDTDIFDTAMRQILEGRALVSTDYRILIANDTEKWCRMIVETNYDAGGNPAQILGIIQDITTRRRAKLALLISERNFREFFENTEISIWDEDLSEVRTALDSLRLDGVNDLRGYLKENMQVTWDMVAMVKVTHVNRATLRLFRARDEDEMISRISTTFGPNSIEVFIEELCAIWTNQKFFRSEVDFRTLDGEVLNTIISFQIPEAIEGFKSVPVSIINITDRKEAEAQLKHQQSLLEKSQELGHIGAWELDISNNQLTWTDENCRIFGVPIGSVLNYELFIERVHPEDREYVDREWRAAMKGKPYDIEHRILIAGETKWVIEKGNLVFDAEGKAVSAIGFTQDVTEIKSFQEKAIRAAQMASVGELSAEIAHEINNPLSGMIGCAQVLLNRADDDSKHKEILGRIIKEGNRIAKIVGGLLTLSYDSGDKKVSQDIEPIILDAVALMSHQIEKKCICLEVNLAEGLPQIKCNAQRLEQVVLNIVKNAYQALLEGVPKEGTEKIIKLDTKRVEIDNKMFVQLTIANNGPSIPEELLSRINEPFFTTKPVGIGTGLGLSITNDIMKNHGGVLEVKSGLGEFTEMILSIPIAECTQGDTL